MDGQCLTMLRRGHSGTDTQWASGKATRWATTPALDDRAWLDAWGTPISTNARVEERWKRIAPDRLQLQITVNDPVYYTRPWTRAPMVYILQPRNKPQEIIFAPMDMEHFTETLLVPSSRAAK